MKKHINVTMACLLIVAMFLLGSCTVEYRARHNHPGEGQHQDMNHDDHHDDHH